MNYLKMIILCIVAFAFTVQGETIKPHVPGELVVKVKEGLIADFFLSSNDLLISRKVNNSTFVVNSEEKEIKKTMERLKNSPFVEYVEPNYIYKINTKDPKFKHLWGLDNKSNSHIDAIRAWNKYGKGSKEIKIAVIDTGIDYNHPDLKGNIWINEAEANGLEGVDDDNNGYIDDVHGYDFANNDGDPMDDNSHGTHCAGTIGASHNKIGVAGVMGNVSLVPIKFLSANGSGSATSAVEAIDYATKLGVNIMSNSWGGTGASKAIKDAIERAEEKGIIFVAAAGNSGSDNDVRPHYPSSYELDNVISVAAHTIKDKLAYFSCYGKNTVDVSAPGSSILSTAPNNGYKMLSGTSMATPHVAGMLGMLLSNEEDLPLLQVRERLIETSEPMPAYKNMVKANGRVNLYNLLSNTRPERL